MKSSFIDRVCRSIVSHPAAQHAVLMTLMLAFSATELFAQSEPLRPPTTKAPPSSPKFIVLGVAVLLTGLVVFVATLKSKRGHQD